MEQPVTPAPSRALTIAQLVLSIFGLLFSLGGMLGLIVMLVSPFQYSLTPEESSQFMNILWVLLAVALLTIPSIITSIRALAGFTPRHPIRHKFLLATVGFLIVLTIIFSGNLLNSSSIPQWLSSVINVLTILVPIWWFLELGRLRLSNGSAQRQWGLFVFSTYVSLPVIIIVEIIVLGFGVLFGALWLIQQPEFAPILSQFGDPFIFDPAALEYLSFDFLPLLTRPGLIAVVGAFVVLIIPLLEELLKPLGIWLLHKRNLTPVDGFTIGMICGAAFAVLESLFSISAVMPGERMFVMVGRIGTGLLHIFTAGINGWALASTWQDSKYIRVGITYFASVIVHGTWNLFAMLLGLHMVGNELPQIVDPRLSGIAVWFLPLLTMVLLISMIGFNLHLRRQPAPPPIPQTHENGLG